jgi:hypothetical protein
LRMNHQTPIAMRAKAATPPTTPPAIAPAFELDFPDDSVGVGDCVLLPPAALLDPDETGGKVAVGIGVNVDSGLSGMLFSN